MSKWAYQGIGTLGMQWVLDLKKLVKLAYEKPLKQIKTNSDEFINE